MNNNLKNEINSYVKTGMITFFVVVGIVTAITIYSWLNIPSGVKNPKTTLITDDLDYYLIDFLIEKNQYLLQKHPKNYGYNIRLGTLYSMKKDYINAEKELKKAVEKSPYLEYKARYNLASLYIKMNKLDEAKKLMEEITDKPDKKLIKNKGIIYKGIGEKYFEQKFYPKASSHFEKSLFYLKKCDKKLAQEVELNLAKSYEKIGDVFVEKGMYEEAIFYLEKANKINNNPEINYKLALLYLDTNPQKAFDLLDIVYKKKPELLNYYMYYDLIMTLSELADEEGNTAKRDLYALKAKRFETFVADNLLYKDDISLHFSEVTSSYDKKSHIFKTNIKLQLRNNSPFNIKNLSAEIVFKEGNKEIKQIIKPIFEYENFFPISQQSSIINIPCEFSKEALNPQFISLNADLYLFKNSKYKLFVKNYQIKKPFELLK